MPSASESMATEFVDVLLGLAPKLKLYLDPIISGLV
jgi:hypothetical protein